MLHCVFCATILMLYAGCESTEKPLAPVDRVIQSMSDTLPVMQLPADVNPEDENWLGVDLSPKAPVLPLRAAEAAKQFLLPPGYRIEPILTEPEIEQPGAIAFDGNGRMYVLELRTYMLTADSDGTLDPVSRISRWEDRDQDGVYETGTTFVDSLIFPRFVLPYGKDAVLAMESDADVVYKYTDTDSDGRADQKTFFTDRYGRSGNVEHQQAFMYWGMDNWLYSTVNAFRVRETPHGITREKTGYNRAQWGITHDDDGKLWFLGGASGHPSYFQFPIHYGNFEVEDQFAPGFEIPWGAPIKIGDMQGGMDEIRQPDGSLKRVTGAAGNDIFRGDRLIAADFTRLLMDQHTDVVIQAMLTAHHLSFEQDIAKVMTNRSAKGIQLVGKQLLQPLEVSGIGVGAGLALSDAAQAQLERGAVIYQELCSQCHGKDGQGTPLGPDQLLAPPLAGSARVQGHPNYAIQTVLHGLRGPIDGHSYAGGVMVGNHEQSDAWIAAVVSYIRNAS